jgi:hypothetical protein
MPTVGKFVLLHVAYFGLLIAFPFLFGSYLYPGASGAAGLELLVLYLAASTGLFLYFWQQSVAALDVASSPPPWSIFVSGLCIGAVLIIFFIISLAIGFGLRN